MARKPPTTPKPQPDDRTAGRQARVAAVRQAQQSRERRNTVTIVGVCAVLVLLLGGVITYGVVDARRNQAQNLVVAVGTPAAAASCDPVTTDPASGNAVHVGPGTNQPDVTKVNYSTVPPSSGSHFVTPALGRQFYTTSDTPAFETLVHNLEHGYTILWYLPSAVTGSSGSTGGTDQLREIARLGNQLEASRDKFIVAPWNDAYGQFPAGKNYALSHWSATTDDNGQVTSQNGHRQLCGTLSGEVVSAFVAQFPRTDAVEPQGA